MGADAVGVEPGGHRVGRQRGERAQGANPELVQGGSQLRAAQDVDGESGQEFPAGTGRDDLVGAGGSAAAKTSSATETPDATGASRAQHTQSRPDDLHPGYRGRQRHHDRFGGSGLADQVAGVDPPMPGTAAGRRAAAVRATLRLRRSV